MQSGVRSPEAVPEKVLHLPSQVWGTQWPSPSSAQNAWGVVSGGWEVAGLGTCCLIFLFQEETSLSWKEGARLACQRAAWNHWARCSLSRPRVHSRSLGSRAWAGTGRRGKGRRRPAATEASGRVPTSAGTSLSGPRGQLCLKSPGAGRRRG